MDPFIVAEIESSYAGQLVQKARDPVTQKFDMQQLLIRATNSKKKVNNTRNLISIRTTKIISVRPGFSAIATTVAAADVQVVPSLASVSEILSGITPLFLNSPGFMVGVLVAISSPTCTILRGRLPALKLDAPTLASMS